MNSLLAILVCLALAIGLLVFIIYKLRDAGYISFGKTDKGAAAQRSMGEEFTRIKDEADANWQKLHDKISK